MIADLGTVFVVDDDAGIRKALTRAIEAAGLKAISFGSAREFLSHEPVEGPSCLVLDVRLPGLSGLDLQAEMNARRIATPIIFITGHGDVPMTVKAMKGGAVDFLTKPFNLEKLLPLIRDALKNHERIQAATAQNTEIARRLQLLTPREREVLALVVQGRLNKQIAAELGAAEKTVKIHRGRVMHKMRVSSVAELVRAVDVVEAREAPQAGI